MHMLVCGFALLLVSLFATNESAHAAGAQVLSFQRRVLTAELPSSRRPIGAFDPDFRWMPILPGVAGPTGTPSRSTPAAPAPAPEADPEFEVVLEFSGGTSRRVGRFQSSDRELGIRFSAATIREISTAHPQEVAQLAARRVLADQTLGEPARTPVFIGGESDFACARPVIILDFNGTIDRRDRCTGEAINSLTGPAGVTAFVVSTEGTGVMGSLRSLGFTHMERILVLERSESSGSWGGSEKATRVAEMLHSTGACIIGIAGDTPDKEGTAANILGIPYLAVNQTDRTLYRTERTSRRTCRKTIPERVRRERAEDACPAGYFNDDEFQAKCERDVPGGRTETVWRNIFTVTRSGSVPDADQVRRTCEMEGLRSLGRYRAALACRLPYGNPGFEEAAPSPSGVCPGGFTLQTIEETNQIPTGTEPSFDIADYPEGSIYSRDWCELRTGIEALIREMRGETAP